jgi:non-canonical (house-cleaning) NTP pyrophosphatase
VASQNSSKLEGTRLALEKLVSYQFLEDHPVKGASLDFGVTAQPYSHVQINLGAINRLNNLKVVYPEACFWVSIENGLLEEQVGDNCELWEMIGYAVVKCASTLQRTLVRTTPFMIPDGLTRFLKEGYELSEAMGMYYDASNSKETGVV